MDKEAARRVIRSTQRQALLGFTPRHVLDIRLGSDEIDARYEEGARSLLEQAASRSEEICSTLERQCPELSSLEEAGLSDRVRYLTTIASVAAEVDGRLDSGDGLDVFAYLKTIHGVVENWREGATYDLSNVLGALRFLPSVGRSRDDILGLWIWLNLGEGDGHRHYTWVKSSMRFAHGYGNKILKYFGSDAS